MQTPPPSSDTADYPRPGLDQDRQRLREVAASQRQVMFCILGQVGVYILNGVVMQTRIPALVYGGVVLVLALLAYMLISVVKLANALRKSPVLYAILIFAPCVSLIMLLLLSDAATKQLKQEGIKVGLLGADPNSI